MRITAFISTAVVLYAATITASPLHNDMHIMSKRGFTQLTVRLVSCTSNEVEMVGEVTDEDKDRVVTIVVKDKQGIAVYDANVTPTGVTEFTHEATVPNNNKIYTAIVCIIIKEDETECTEREIMPCNVEKDPHMTTFDGVKYNFQGLCTYVLTQDCRDVTKPSFQITADFRGKYSELREKPLTRVDAVNINVGATQLVRILKNNHFLIKGQLFKNSSAVIGNGEGTVEMVGNDLHIDLNEPDLSLTWSKDVRGVLIHFKDERMRGNVCGLLGNNNDNPDDEFMKRGGEMLTKADIYEFGNSWEVPGSCP